MAQTLNYTMKTRRFVFNGKPTGLHTIFNDDLNLFKYNDLNVEYVLQGFLKEETSLQLQG